MIYYRNECGWLNYEFEDVMKLFFLRPEMKKAGDSADECGQAFIYCGRHEFNGQDCVVIRLRDGAYDEETGIPLEVDLLDGNGQDSGAGIFTGSGSQPEHKQEIKAFKRIFKRKLFLLLQEYTGKTIPWGIMTGIRPAKLVNEFLDRNRSRDDIISTLEQNYFVTADKAGLLYKVALNQRHLFAGSVPGGVSFYIGIPFCPTRCLYCSFSSSTVGQYKKMVDAYIEALLEEIGQTASLIKKKGLRIESLYMGGGTPTSINGRQLSHLLEGIESHLELEDLKEYTLEAGRPDTIDREKLKIIKNSRVSRISINPQTMNSSTLERIGRNHTPAEAEEAYWLARELGFDNINMDLICGLPGEDPAMFRTTLEKISQLGPDSLTIHTMAVKRASRLTAEMGNYNLETEFRQVADMVDMAGIQAGAMGLEPYYLYRQKDILGNLENVGYSRKGKECVYNIQIMEEKQSVIACGAGAVTKVVFPQDRIERAFNVKSVEEYIGRLDEMIGRKARLFELLQQSYL